MKVVPILDAFERRNRLGAEVLLVHTGQHYDANMSDGFFEDLGLPVPHIHLGVGSGTHAQQTARVMIAFEEVCLEEKPDWVDRCRGRKTRRWRAPSRPRNSAPALRMSRPASVPGT